MGKILNSKEAIMEAVLKQMADVIRDDYYADSPKKVIDQYLPTHPKWQYFIEENIKEITTELSKLIKEEASLRF